ncbi:MAG: DUF1805 domain-containing protein [Candidatus Omnitrophica bacterium]|jgi:Uncharacterized conserved protein|nr:DUF1805 domain-containing protein [Candidatus Omnitrophota bacterium]
MFQSVCGEVLISNVRIKTFLLTLTNANLILAAAPAGLVMCGYLDIAAAEKIGDAACVVSGVRSVEELLDKPVVKLTAQAQERGISIGMSGREALRHLL